MERLQDSSERQIMPAELLKYYIKARTETYASGKKPELGLNVVGFKGYKYPEELKEDDRFVYEDNFKDSKSRPGNFGGFEVIKDVATDEEITLFDYAGGLTKAGLRLGEKVVYDRLVKFLGDYVSEVRFGKTVTFDFEDELGKWAYEGKGKVEDYGWADDESISLNGVEMYKLRGTGLVFLPGF